MSKVAFVFPGQGSQKVGMGKDFFDNYACAKKVFSQSLFSGVTVFSFSRAADTAASMFPPSFRQAGRYAAFSFSSRFRATII